MQKITPFLWYDGKAEEAAKFYTSIFKKSRIGSIRRYGEGGPGPKGSVFVDCKAQEEVAELWDKLSAGGEKQKCGWLKDRYGVSWQVIPGALGEMLQDKDPEKSQRVMKAMLQMDKIDVERLKQAYGGRNG